jgi:hypothetical protein
MNARSKFLNLKEEWKSTDDTGRESIEKKMDAFFNSLSEEEKKEVQSAVSDDFSSMHKEISEINKLIDVREKLSPILPMISISYISKHFFGKSTSWFYQRLNGNLIHGKPVKFTDDERKKLSIALQSIGKTLNEASFEIS